VREVEEGGLQGKAESGCTAGFVYGGCIPECREARKTKQIFSWGLQKKPVLQSNTLTSASPSPFWSPGFQNTEVLNLCCLRYYDSYDNKNYTMCKLRKVLGKGSGRSHADKIPYTWLLTWASFLTT
jgi:hypothetical protein